MFLLISNRHVFSMHFTVPSSTAPSSNSSTNSRNMFVECCIPNCSAVYKTGCPNSFHDIPKDPVRSSKWLTCIRGFSEVTKNFEFHSGSKICGWHFNEDDFEPNIFYNVTSSTYGTRTRKILKSLAEPRCSTLSTIVEKSHTMPSANTDIVSKRKRENDSFIGIVHSDSPKIAPSHIKASSNNSDFNHSIIDRLKNQVKDLKNEAACLKRVIERRDQSILNAKSKNETTIINRLHDVLDDVIEKANQDNDTKAIFLLDQLAAFNKERYRWNEVVLRECVIWQATSPKGYEYGRNNCFRLPHMTTLRKYTGPITGQVGVTDLVKQRLSMEIQELGPMERFGSLIIDEMSLSEKLIYDKDHDRFYGHVEINHMEEPTIPAEKAKPQLANHLLCFVLEGLSTRFVIPVAYYFTRNLKALELTSLTRTVISEVEKCGLVIVIVKKIQLFSPVITAAIKFLKDNSGSHPNAHEFYYANPTLKYMEACCKWWQIHNVSNRTHHIHSREPDKNHFFETSDERLVWLEEDFPEYLEMIKKETLSRGLVFMSKETHQAVVHTSIATSKCIKHLLEQGFHFVLTRYFNSDPVESIFCALRLMCGTNDMVDVRAAICILEKMLKIGITV